VLVSSKILQIKMSLSLFNAISPCGSADHAEPQGDQGEPAGSIEVLSDEKGAPYFKRADLGSPAAPLKEQGF